MIFVTGDPHGAFGYIANFCRRMNTTKDTEFVILGDVGANFYLDKNDIKTKTSLSHLQGTFFCIHGNHEARPCPELGYHKAMWHGGEVWVEDSFPNLLFAIDGEVYDLDGQACIVIGGAYSVDKHYRLQNNWPWFPDEQPSPAIKEKVERVLEERGWKIDVVISHTCPYKYLPREVFLDGINQNLVDNTTERWLDKIEDRLEYKKWFCGHYHTDKKIDKLEFLFHEFSCIPQE